MAVRQDHRLPVEPLKLADQETGRRQERRAEDQKGEGNENSRTRHGLPQPQVPPPMGPIILCPAPLG